MEELLQSVENLRRLTRNLEPNAKEQVDILTARIVDLIAGTFAGPVAVTPSSSPKSTKTVATCPYCTKQLNITLS